MSSIPALINNITCSLLFRMLLLSGFPMAQAEEVSIQDEVLSSGKKIPAINLPYKFLLIFTWSLIHTCKTKWQRGLNQENNNKNNNHNIILRTNLKFLTCWRGSSDLGVTHNWAWSHTSALGCRDGRQRELSWSSAQLFHHKPADLRGEGTENLWYDCHLTLKRKQESATCGCTFWSLIVQFD